jgi:solute carrier family 25 aspartate/glutamate transporter 12/13
MASVKEAVKESLVGTTIEEPGLSKQIRANFLRHARKDEETGELYMTESDFVEAIAPKHEDYVSFSSFVRCVILRNSIDLL